MYAADKWLEFRYNDDAHRARFLHYFAHTEISMHIPDNYLLCRSIFDQSPNGFRIRIKGDTLQLSTLEKRQIQTIKAENPAFLHYVIWCILHVATGPATEGNHDNQLGKILNLSIEHSPLQAVYGKDAKEDIRQILRDYNDNDRGSVSSDSPQRGNRPQHGYTDGNASSPGGARMGSTRTTSRVNGHDSHGIRSTTSSRSSSSSSRDSQRLSTRRLMSSSDAAILDTIDNFCNFLYSHDQDSKLHELSSDLRYIAMIYKDHIDGAMPHDYDNMIYKYVNDFYVLAADCFAKYEENTDEMYIELISQLTEIRKSVQSLKFQGHESLKVFYYDDAYDIVRWNIMGKMDTAFFEAVASLSTEKWKEILMSSLIVPMLAYPVWNNDFGGNSVGFRPFRAIYSDEGQQNITEKKNINEIILILEYIRGMSNEGEKSAFVQAPLVAAKENLVYRLQETQNGGQKHVVCVSIKTRAIWRERTISANSCLYDTNIDLGGNPDDLTDPYKYITAKHGSGQSIRALWTKDTRTKDLDLFLLSLFPIGTSFELSNRIHVVVAIDGTTLCYNTSECDKHCLIDKKLQFMMEEDGKLAVKNAIQQICEQSFRQQETRLNFKIISNLVSFRHKYTGGQILQANKKHGPIQCTFTDQPTTSDVQQNLLEVFSNFELNDLLERIQSRHHAKPDHTGDCYIQLDSSEFIHLGKQETASTDTPIPVDQLRPWKIENLDIQTPTPSPAGQGSKMVSGGTSAAGSAKMRAPSTKEKGPEDTQKTVTPLQAADQQIITAGSNAAQEISSLPRIPDDQKDKIESAWEEISSEYTQYKSKPTDSSPEALQFAVNQLNAIIANLLQTYEHNTTYYYNLLRDKLEIIHKQVRLLEFEGSASLKLFYYDKEYDIVRWNTMKGRDKDFFKVVGSTTGSEWETLLKSAPVLPMLKYPIWNENFGGDNVGFRPFRMGSTVARGTDDTTQDKNIHEIILVLEKIRGLGQEDTKADFMSNPYVAAKGNNVYRFRPNSNTVKKYATCKADEGEDIWIERTISANMCLNICNPTFKDDVARLDADYAYIGEARADDTSSVKDLWMAGSVTSELDIFLASFLTIGTAFKMGELYCVITTMEVNNGKILVTYMEADTGPQSKAIISPYSRETKKIDIATVIQNIFNDMFNDTKRKLNSLLISNLMVFAAQYNGRSALGVSWVGSGEEKEIEFKFGERTDDGKTNMLDVFNMLKVGSFAKMLSTEHETAPTDKKLAYIQRNTTDFIYLGHVKEQEGSAQRGDGTAPPNLRPVEIDQPAASTAVEGVKTGGSAAMPMPVQYNAPCMRYDRPCAQCQARAAGQAACMPYVPAGSGWAAGPPGPMAPYHHVPYARHGFMCEQPPAMYVRIGAPWRWGS